MKTEQGYNIIEEVEDYFLNHPSFGETTKWAFTQGTIDHRVSMCRIMRMFQKENEKVDGPMILDRCELDLSIYCGMLGEEYSIKYERWNSISQDLGEMVSPDLVLFFRFFPGSCEGDPRKELAVQRRDIYLRLEEQLYCTWQEYLKDKSCSFKLIGHTQVQEDKHREIKDIIDSTDAKRVVLTGASHAGKTTFLASMFSK